MSQFAASVARLIRLTAERERAGGLVTTVSKARVDFYERTATHFASIGSDDAGIRALERIQIILGGEGSWTPGDAQQRVMAKWDGSWASAAGRDNGIEEPSVEDALAQLVDAGITDIAHEEARKTQAAHDATKGEIHQRKLAERELSREREKVQALRDEIDLIRQAEREEAARVKPILARHAALLDGLITAEEAAELLHADKPEPVKS